MLELYLLMGFMIIAAILAIELEDLVSSVVALAATGLLLCVTFIVLKAPDVAIMQLVVETLALVVLIKATSRADLPFSASGRWYINTLVYIVFFITLISIAMKCFLELPPFGEPHMRFSAPYLEAMASKAGAGDMISAVTLHFRTFDVLGEATILFAAVLGVLTIMRPAGRKGEKKTASEDEND